MSIFYRNLIRRLSKFLFLLLLLTANKVAVSQDFMMQGWYWDYPKTTVGFNWSDTIRLNAAELGRAGFTGIWLPPLARASYGNSSNGYDPKDLYDYGEYGGGATGFGTRQQLNNCIAALTAAGVNPVADLVFNHRDGGKAEVNTGVSNYIAGFNWDKANSGANPFPYDRMRCILPVGGSSGNGAGHYYFKISSSSGHSKYFNYEYKVYMQTNKVGWQNLTAESEAEPNGGGDCSQADNDIHLGRDMNAIIDASGCTVDEFHLNLSTSDFNAAGDTIFIYFGKRNSDYSDMRIYGIWSGPRIMNIIGDLKYQTYTDFSGMPSGQGLMNWSNFKPNNDRATSLAGDWDGMYFFYDYDQFQTDTKNKLTDWAKWNWSNVGIRGLRMDAVKHFTPEFIGDLLDNLHDNAMDPPVVVGEWYSTNTSELAGWINNVLGYMDADTKAAIKPRIFDFSLRDALRNACDTYGYDVRNVFSSSLVDAASLSGFNVVTFVNNHDFRDASGFASLIQNNAILAYAYLLTNNKLGLPCVFYPDYFGYPDNGSSYYPADRNGMKRKIDLLMNIHKSYIFGSTSVTYLNKTGSGYSNDAGSANSYLLTYQLKGAASGKDVVVAINFGGTRAQFHQELNGLAVGTKLTDMMGVTPYSEAVVNTNENGIPNDIWIDLPARSFAVWVQGAANSLAPLPASGLAVSYPVLGTITLNWLDNSSNETGFRIERKTCSGSWSTLATVGSNTTTYPDAGGATSEHYYYRVIAVNGILESGAGNVTDGSLTPTWTGTSDTKWDVATNWCSGRIPSSITDAVIPSCGVTYLPAINTISATCNNLTIQSGAQLNINPLQALTVLGTLTNNAGVTGLVIKSDATGTGSLITNSAAEATVERYLTGSMSAPFPWHMVSSPVSGQSIPGFVTSLGGNIATNSTKYGLAPYINSIPNWIPYTTTTLPGAGNFGVAKGYEILLNTPAVCSFTGNLTASNTTVPVTTAASAWNLIGNPFSSAINASNVANNFITVNDGLFDPSYKALYVWNGSTYTIINNAVPAYIPCGQGFFIKSIAGGGNAAFNTNIRTHNTAAFSKSMTTELPSIELKASIAGMNRSTQVFFIPGTSTGMDAGFDAGMFDAVGTENTLYSHIDGSDIGFGIQCLPENQIHDITIPIGINAKQGMTITFTAITANLPQDTKVYLYDKLSAIYTRLDIEGSSYQVTLTAESSGIGRFYISTSNKTMGTGNPKEDRYSITALPAENKIRVTGCFVKGAQACISDMSGRILTTIEFGNTYENDIPFSTTVDGIYLLSIRNGINTEYRKIVWIY